jgi:hypothetical protein
MKSASAICRLPGATGSKPGDLPLAGVNRSIDVRLGSERGPRPRVARRPDRREPVAEHNGRRRQELGRVLAAGEQPGSWPGNADRARGPEAFGEPAPRRPGRRQGPPARGAAPPERPRTARQEGGIGNQQLRMLPPDGVERLDGPRIGSAVPRGGRPSAASPRRTSGPWSRPAGRCSTAVAYSPPAAPEAPGRSRRRAVDRSRLQRSQGGSGVVDGLVDWPVHDNGKLLGHRPTRTGAASSEQRAASSEQRRCSSANGARSPLLRRTAVVAQPSDAMVHRRQVGPTVLAASRIRSLLITVVLRR